MAKKKSKWMHKEIASGYEITRYAIDDNLYGDDASRVPFNPEWKYGSDKQKMEESHARKIEASKEYDELAAIGDSEEKDTQAVKGDG